MKEIFKQHGAFSWFELMTSDVDSEKNFYSNLFGWNTEDMSMGEMDYTVVKVGQEAVGGPPNWGVYITVDDVDATSRKAEDLGGKILVPPTDIPTVAGFACCRTPREQSSRRSPTPTANSASAEILAGCRWP
jgi:predicted enzyme related to lactoylglutathione lyase